MQGFAKAILISLLACTVLLIFTNFVFFFPWYMTLAYETYNLSTLSAQHNYIDSNEAEDILDVLNNKPIFREHPLTISDGIVGPVDKQGVYQRGEQFDITLKAYYPFRVKIAGYDIRQDMPVSFTISTTCLYFDKKLAAKD